MTSYVYSDRDLVTRETSEISGVTTYAYNEHGALTAQTDARNVTVSHTVDAFDRVVLDDYPANALDTTYTWDDPAVPFSKGRLTAVTRNGQTVAQTYDRFGRMLQDGALSYGWDPNGNRQAVTYPGNVKALYTFDFADRQASLALQDGAGPSQTLIGSASYKAFGPLTGGTLGNGLTESRSFNARYFPAGISVPGRLDWAYTTDSLGNVTGVTDNLNAAGSRSFAYQDFQYFLTQGNGPWGARGWTYDRNGDRLSEIHDGVTDTYGYAPNAAAANSSRLVQITRGAGGASQWLYDPAGELVSRSDGQAKLRLVYGDDQRLSQLRGDAAGQGLAQLTYDGRSFLSRATFLSTPGGTVPEIETTATYSSSGLLHHRQQIHRRGPSSPRNLPEVRSDAYVLYFGDRPAALFDKRLSTPPVGSPTSTTSLTWLTDDSLGTPILATDAAGAAVWQGGFEPFGEDWNGAQASGVFLRLPGQWEDPTWDNPGLASGLYQNVHRWYQPDTGRYERPDPLSFSGGQLNLFAYAADNPLRLADPLGLAVTFTPDCFHLLSAQQRQTVQNAADDADAAGYHCLRCPEKPRFRRTIRNLTIRCVAVSSPNCAPGLHFCGSRSDITTCSTTPLPDNQIILTPDGATGTQCPCLPRVIMHETLHILRGPGHPGGGTTFPEVRRCLRNCGRGYPGIP